MGEKDNLNLSAMAAVSQAEIISEGTCLAKFQALSTQLKTEEGARNARRSHLCSHFSPLQPSSSKVERIYKYASPVYIFVLDKYFNSNRTPQSSVPFTWNQP